ncbi:MAG: 4-hydroxybenzoate octaprenyltransferase [Zetaproteobacteria bacterium CG_4_9_14_3_um_filter_49_83]|nr:MAG: 4-hydroxybenzoate polyprenyltransferase [Zetaproteobacteria bacterium CG1_02_49_23]PIQ29959.1 MAG: 4-hydroxybenzoate octaprenyltransferase [Zetaproteobacteria bacterium CG17_big_fil_post_rev_8_21_14_2_50_50_13]PIV31456.1 MAG: 4-hydroxybenzoate octaprenyltransferase [Zetaproteobacteria bacterium CG02_land_8_20_14_3_00_50_9]PIY55022.1 MAG: 4-hydroxybenzoate octaprenyltransferase [Zetaproteobacteria bacterium CG_4_10_14_0_8_um_filter_49_80]PJA36526.1 MAG: 4-hydroxybenzoate octaprenyltransf
MGKDVIQSNKLHVWGRLMRVEKPIGTYLVSWPMLWALWIAGAGHPDAFIVAIFLAGAFLMRSAGCVINDYADRDIDGAVERTSGRPLATGEATTTEALVLFVLLILAAFLLVLLLNALTIQLSFAAVLLAALYPFMKRITHLPQLFLGMAFAWSIPMAFAAVTNQLPLAAWLLFIATVCWVIAYDTMYAMVDRDDDLEIGVKSTAILFGRYDRHIIVALQVSMLLLLLALGFMLNAGIFYYLGLLVALGFSLYQQRLIYHRQKQACFQAFLNNHYLGAVIFLGLFLDYAVRSVF